MEPLLTTHEIRKTNFLTYLTLILFGVFFTSVIFAFTVKLFEIPGIWIGLIVCVAIIATIFYYKPKGSRSAPTRYLRVIAWSMLATLIIGTTIYFVGLNYVKNTLEEFQTK